MINMPRPTGPTNILVKKMIQELSSRGYKEKNKFLIAIAKRLKGPTRKRPKVNLLKIERYCSKNDTIIVPGEVLSTGTLTKPLTIAALSFSKAAKEKIKAAGGQTIEIPELIKINPRGSKVKIIC